MNADGEQTEAEPVDYLRHRLNRATEVEAHQLIREFLLGFCSDPVHDEIPQFDQIQS